MSETAPSSQASGAWRTAASVALVSSTLLGVATLRAVRAGEEALAAADQALRAGEPGLAIAAAGRAARAYAPGAPHVPAAYQRLIHVARTSEVALERERALLAWREVRQAALETRWLAQPHARELAMANDAIARLSGDDPRAPLAREATSDDVTARARQLLSQDAAARRPAVALLLVGLGLSAAGALAALVTSRLGRSVAASAALGALGLALYAVAVLWL